MRLALVKSVGVPRIWRIGLTACLIFVAPQARASSENAYAFEEPLVATAPTSAQEDRELARSIEAYRTRTSPDDTTALTAFVSGHPGSPWRLALLTNIGLSDYHYGYFSRAIKDFQAAWTDGRMAAEPRAKALADKAAGELLRMHARLGHVDELTTLLSDMKGRGLSGPASEMRDGAIEGLWIMHNQPGVAYLCGPMALKNLLRAGGASSAATDFLDAYRSGPHGVTLAEVSRLADQAKLSHTLIHREAGEPIPVPSIVHWKVNHYAAIIGQQGDRFHVEDPTFGQTLWVTRHALDAESSGYFLVPTSKVSAPPARRPWKMVSADEAVHVYGMGTTEDNDHTKITRKSPKTKKCGGGGSGSGIVSVSANRGLCDYNFSEMLVSLDLTDTPVGYKPPKGPPVQVAITYNQREESQPANFSFFNVSPKWTLNFLSYIQDDPTMAGATVTRYVAGGGESDYVGYSSTTQSFAPDVQDQSVLSIAASSPVQYKRTMPDGSYEIYATSNGATTFPRLVFLSEIVDQAGNALHLTYDSTFRLTSITDATGRKTVFAYTQSGQPLLVTKITDPFGRSASLGYDGSGRLVQITDVLGLKSQFSYDASSLVNALTTPYGTTTFTYGDNGNSRFLQATDPLGYVERLEYVQGTNTPFSDPPSSVPGGIGTPFNQFLNARDTFYWDKHAWAQVGENYGMARIRHWDHLASNTNITSDTLESVKYPLENRIWYAHPGQPTTGLGAGVSGTDEAPSAIARVLDDGSTQATQIQYNGIGNISAYTDPAGRQAQMQYAGNQVDVLTVQQNTATGLANVAQFTYNAHHQPLTYTDAAGQKTTYTYNSAGQKLTETNALGQMTSYTYNALGYLTSVVNANKKKVLSLAYDAAGNISVSTDSEGHAVIFKYDALDRVISETYPDKTTRIFTYTNLDLTAEKDRQGRVTSYKYDADRNLVSVKDPAGAITQYGYYENGTLASITDPDGHTTKFGVDIESRLTSKTYPDGSAIGYGYEAATGRLLYTVDLMKQIKQYSYTHDDQIAGITYFNAVHATPGVSFTYDQFFPRLASMTDGNGTTVYQYGAPGALGALHLVQETPPFANATIAYGYDALGRMNARSVGGNMETFAYDPIGRLVTHADDLGTFTRTYFGQTDELTGQTSGRLSTIWGYDTNANDRRLTSISTAGGTTYGLKSSAENDLTSQTDSTNNLTWTFGYDGDDRLKTVTPSAGSKYSYTYDPAGNLLTAVRPKGTSKFVSNAGNQIVSLNGVKFTYDANGNLLRDYARTYAYDADNRLISVGIIGQPTLSTSFRYDGLGRRTAIDTTSGTVTTEKRYAWCGETVCQARTSGDVISRRYFAEGENSISDGVAYYYGTDQVGSVRDAINAATGAVVAHYDYEPYGAQSNTALATTDLKYAGLFFNAQTGLYLATYRALDPMTGKWTSRDQVDESDAPNLYGYGDGDPVTKVDQSGVDVDPAFTQMHGSIPHIRDLNTMAEEYKSRERIPGVTKIQHHKVRPVVHHTSMHKEHPKPPKKMRREVHLPKPTKMCIPGGGGPRSTRDIGQVAPRLQAFYGGMITGYSGDPVEEINGQVGNESRPPSPVAEDPVGAEAEAAPE